VLDGEQKRKKSVSTAINKEEKTEEKNMCRISAGKCGKYSMTFVELATLKIRRYLIDIQ
jgi:hypothetical protein